MHSMMESYQQSGRKKTAAYFIDNINRVSPSFIYLQLSKRNFRFYHPKFCQMPGSVGMLYKNGWPKGIHNTKRTCKGLDLKFA